ncbi:outer membrane beta-barrel protein [Pedobacter sp. 22226]|uniref:outer membrane beta-barrel protein n=1 Tax=Pedobacter sp. 22226 TaxID=3453894 RepID=UPI003F832FB1
MKIRLTLLMCFLMAQLTSYAQNKSTVSFHLGASIPLNDFASKDENNELAGYAKTGYSIALGYDYRIIKNFGLQALVKIDNNDFSESDLQRAARTSGTNWTVTADNWNSASFLAGFYYAFPVGTKTDIFFRALAGAVSIKEPATNLAVTANNQNYYINKAEKSSTAFNYLVGIGLKQSISERLAFLANVDYSDSKVEFSDVVYSSNIAPISGSTTKTKLTKVNIGIGLGYKF